MSPQLFLWLTISGRCWVGLLKLQGSIWILRGRHAKMSKKISRSSFLVNNFMEICAIMHPTIQFGPKKRKLIGVKLLERAPKTHFFDCAAKAAA